MISLMHAALQLLTCDERVLEVGPGAWHTYEIRWWPDTVTFFVDDRTVLESSVSPDGPLGFVTWIDNQYAVASAGGGLRFGVVPTETEQSLDRARAAQPARCHLRLRRA